MPVNKFAVCEALQEMPRKVRWILLFDIQIPHLRLEEDLGLAETLSLYEESYNCVSSLFRIF